MKNLIATAFIVFIGLSYFTSCTKAPVSPLIGTWRKIVSADTFYIKATDNSNLQYGETLDSGYVELGLGTYTYTPAQFTFTVLSNPDSVKTGICIGYPATYSYVITGTQLTLAVVTDTCHSSANQLRSSMINGNWTQQYPY